MEPKIPLPDSSIANTTTAININFIFINKINIIIKLSKLKHNNKKYVFWQN
jgi:hypothetical protein